MSDPIVIVPDPVAIRQIEAGPQGPPATDFLVSAEDGLQLLAGQRRLADLTDGPLSWIMPASPAEGASVTILVGAAAATNELTLGRNGETFHGAAEDLIVDIADGLFEFRFLDGTWRYF